MNTRVFQPRDTRADSARASAFCPVKLFICRVSRGGREWEEEEKTGRNETFVAGSVIETGWRREGVEEVSGFWMGNILNNREG